MEKGPLSNLLSSLCSFLKPKIVDTQINWKDTASLYLKTYQYLPSTRSLSIFFPYASSYLVKGLKGGSYTNWHIPVCSSKYFSICSFLFPCLFLLISRLLSSYFSICFFPFLISYLVKGLGGRFQPQLTHSSLFPRRGGLSDTRPGVLAWATKALEEIFQKKKEIFQKKKEIFSEKRNSFQEVWEKKYPVKGRLIRNMARGGGLQQKLWRK